MTSHNPCTAISRSYLFGIIQRTTSIFQTLCCLFLYAKKKEVRGLFFHIFVPVLIVPSFSTTPAVLLLWWCSVGLYLNTYSTIYIPNCAIYSITCQCWTWYKAALFIVCIVFYSIYSLCHSNVYVFVPICWLILCFELFHLHHDFLHDGATNTYSWLHFSPSPAPVSATDCR